jgi:Fibronectin type III domain
MRNIPERTVGRSDEVSFWSSRSRRLTEVLGGILFLGLLHDPVQALNAPGYTVTLAWDRSPDGGVNGYRVYYGATSGNYTNSVVVGNVTTNKVSGLSSGVTYFFAITANTAGGLESAFSNEISFVPGLPTVRIRVMSSGQAVLTVTGLIGHTYDIQVTPDLKSWTVIGTVTVGASGSVNFTNSNAPTFPNRFYRTRDTQP